MITITVNILIITVLFSDSGRRGLQEVVVHDGVAIEDELLVI